MRTRTSISNTVDRRRARVGHPLLGLESATKNVPGIFARKNVQPRREYASLGFSLRARQRSPDWCFTSQHSGLDRVFLNCAICHAGSLRETPQTPPVIYAGMPSNTVDLEGFERFIFACSTDQRFNAPQMIAEMESIAASTIHQPISDALLCDPVHARTLAHAQRSFPFR